MKISGMQEKILNNQLQLLKGGQPVNQSNNGKNVKEIQLPVPALLAGKAGSSACRCAINYYKKTGN